MMILLRGDLAANPKKSIRSHRSLDVGRPLVLTQTHESSSLVKITGTSTVHVGVGSSDGPSKTSLGKSSRRGIGTGNKTATNEQQRSVRSVGQAGNPNPNSNSGGVPRLGLGLEGSSDPFPIARSQKHKTNKHVRLSPSSNPLRVASLWWWTQKQFTSSSSSWPLLCVSRRRQQRQTQVTP